MIRTIPIDDLEAVFLAGRLIQTRDLLIAARAQHLPLLTLVGLLQRTHDELRDRLNDRVIQVLMRQSVALGPEPFDLAIEQQPLTIVARLQQAASGM